MKKIISILLMFLGLTLTPLDSVLAGSLVNITRDGVVSITEAKVMQIAGGTLYARLYWGDAYVRFTIKTNSKTKFYRGTGEPTTISEIIEGNLLEVAGELESGSNTLTLIASSIKNASVQKQQTIASGRVTSVDLGARKFTLDSKKFGVITVSVKPETSFIKGNRTLDLGHVMIGDFITKVSGDYDLSSKTLLADSVLTYVDMNYYKAKNFEGKLEAVNGTTLPTSVKVLIGKTSFTVNLNERSVVLSKNKNPALLNRYVVGDSVRLYGVIREVDEPIIDAEILRNMSL